MDEREFILKASIQLAAANPRWTMKKVVDTAENLWDELTERDYDEVRKLTKSSVG